MALSPLISTKFKYSLLRTSIIKVILYFRDSINNVYIIDFTNPFSFQKYSRNKFIQDFLFSPLYRLKIKKNTNLIQCNLN